MSDPKQVQVTFSNRTIIRVVVVIVLSFLGLLFLSKIGHELTLVAVAAFLALALNPAVSWISRHLKLKSRVAATGMAYLIVVAFISLFLWLVLPPLIRQMTSFISELPSNVSQIQSNNTAFSRFIADHHLESQLNTAVDVIQSHYQDIGGTVFNTAGRIGGVIISIITVFVLTFMMLVEGPIWLERLWEMQDDKKVAKRKHAAMRMYKVITSYVNGQLLLAVIAGTFSLIAMLIASTLLGVSINAVVYAAIVTIIGLIPLIGNTIAAVIVVLLCAFTSIPLAIIMAVFFVIYQQVENATLQPIIQAKHNELTPLLVFIAALIGVGFAGLLGALVAIPLAGCLKVFITEFYGHKLGLLTTQKEKAD